MPESAGCRSLRLLSQPGHPGGQIWAASVAQPQSAQQFLSAPRDLAAPAAAESISSPASTSPALSSPARQTGAVQPRVLERRADFQRVVLGRVLQRRELDSAPTVDHRSSRCSGVHLAGDSSSVSRRGRRPRWRPIQLAPNLATASSYLTTSSNLLDGHYYEAFPNSGGFADFGLTIDGALALTASRTDDTALAQLVSWLNGQGKDGLGRSVDDWTGIGSQYVDGGAIAKEALLAEAPATTRARSADTT